MEYRLLAILHTYNLALTTTVFVSTFIVVCGKGGTSMNLPATENKSGITTIKLF